MIISNAKVILAWENGKVTEIGSIEITTDKGSMKAKTTHLRQRIGWELVRKGFALMFQHRKWKAVSE